MKKMVIIARILLGLVFVVFGFDKLVVFIPAQAMPGDAGALVALMVAHKWMMFYGVVETAGGLLLLLGRFVPLALTLLAGMIVNILLFDVTLSPAGLPPGLVAGLLELFLVYAYRDSFAGIFAVKPAPAV